MINGFQTALNSIQSLAATSNDFAGKKGLAEMCMIRRIHFIYERATRKFKADLQLWLKWVEFCKRSDSAKQLSKVRNRNGQRSCSGSPLPTNNVRQHEQRISLPLAADFLFWEREFVVHLLVPKPQYSGLTSEERGRHPKGDNIDPTVSPCGCNLL